MENTSTGAWTGQGSLSFLDELYDESVMAHGEPIGFHLFDTGLSRHIDVDWLLQEVKGVTEDELNEFFRSGLIKKWTDEDGESGFLLYTAEQLRTLKQLKSSGIYENDELQNIMERWHVDIECTLEVLPYDDPGIPDFDHYRRRISEHLEETKQQLVWKLESPEDLKDIDWLLQEQQRYERVLRRLNSSDSTNLSERMQHAISRNLFRMRWIDEWVRIGNAEKFRSAVQQGFSPEVFFSSYVHKAESFEFVRIDWDLTLRDFARVRSRGKKFPLRTPKFTVTDAGITFKQPLTPEDYKEVYERYNINLMLDVLQKLGPGLWHDVSESSIRGSCEECKAAFDRTLAAKRYCSDKCRSRAKQRRYRERDPERARLAQAKYWKNYLGECDL